MRKNLLAMAGLAMLPFLSIAQTMETFESITQTGTVKPTTFTSNGQSFTITTNDCVNGGTFGVFVPNAVVVNCLSSSATNVGGAYGVGTSCTGGVCTGTSAKFIDNGNSNGLGQIYSIKTTNNALFTIKSMHVYLSSDHATNPSAAGGITITGKIAGSTVFTYVKTTGFATTFATNNGFTYLDFSAGTNYTLTNVDELQIQAGNIANYIAIDNFTWGANVPLGLNMESFTANLYNDQVQLKWNENNQSDILEYQIEKSTDGKNFAAIYSLTSNPSGAYVFNDADPVKGNNFYRLKMIFKNGSSEYSAVKSVFVNDRNENTLVYPNPTKGVLYAKVSGATILDVTITDFMGRIVQTAKLSEGSNTLNIEALENGTYFYKATNVSTGKIVGQGKLSKI